MRPKQEERVGFLYVLFSSMLLGLPGIVVGIGALFVVFGTVGLRTCGLIFGSVVLFEMLLHLVFAHYWNRRAAALVEKEGGDQDCNSFRASKSLQY